MYKHFQNKGLVSTIVKYKYRIGIGVTAFTGVNVFQIIEHQRKIRGLNFHDHQIQDKNIIFEENVQTLMIRDESKGPLANHIEIFHMIIRLCQILINFFPVLLVYPLYYLSPSIFYDLYMNEVRKGIERSGSVLVKLAQYISHRPDLIDKRTVQILKHLRDQTPFHSFEHTLKSLIKNKIFQRIEKIDEKAMASGIIGQVYKAKLKNFDEQVVIKVRHPHIIEKLKMDLKLVFTITNALSKIPGFKWMELPVTQSEFVKVLIDQTDFRIEGENLRKFEKNFEGLQDMLCFPKVYYESEDLLIERYVENSHDIEQYFSKFGDEKLRKRLALIGLNSFFRMFIFDNFIHADCHAGNLLVQKCQLQKKKTSFFRKIQNVIDNKVFETFNKIVYGGAKVYFQIRSQLGQVSESERLLYELKQDFCQMMLEQSEIEYNDYTNENLYKIFLIDYGMVSSMTLSDHSNMIRFLHAVCCRDAKLCCKYIKALSQYNNQEMTDKAQEQLNQFEQEMIPAFDKLKDTRTENMDVGALLQYTISTAQKKGMKFDGNVSVFLGNIIVLEGLCRSLDPDICLINFALPYLFNSRVTRVLQEQQ